MFNEMVTNFKDFLSNPNVQSCISNVVSNAIANVPSEIKNKEVSNQDMVPAVFAQDKSVPVVPDIDNSDLANNKSSFAVEFGDTPTTIRTINNEYITVSTSAAKDYRRIMENSPTHPAITSTMQSYIELSIYNTLVKIAQTAMALTRDFCTTFNNTTDTNTDCQFFTAPIMFYFNIERTDLMHALFPIGINVLFLDHTYEDRDNIADAIACTFTQLCRGYIIFGDELNGKPDCYIYKVVSFSDKLMNMIYTDTFSLIKSTIEQISYI